MNLPKQEKKEQSEFIRRTNLMLEDIKAIREGFRQLNAQLDRQDRQIQKIASHLRLAV